jgi:hypothetical protein
MSWTRGDGSTDQELSRAQSWIEFWDPRLDGGNGKGIGMIQEWQEDRAKRRFYHNGLRAMLAVASLLVGVAALMDIAVFVKHW